MKIQKLWISVMLGITAAIIAALSENQSSYSTDDPPILITIFLYAAAFVIIAIFIHVFIVSPIIHFFQRNKGYLARERKLLDGFLKIVAELIKSDGKTAPSEIQHIREALEKDLGTEDADLYMELLDEYLKTPQDIRAICRKIDYELDELSKTQLMFLIMGVATVDGLLSNTELDFLKNVMTWAGLPPKSFIHASRMFNYKRERSYKEKSREKANQQRRSVRSSAIKSAFNLLDIPETASKSVIKAAYRTLAKMHHPDRYAHRGSLEQKKAKEQFQLIAEAYDLVKTHKGFK